MNRKGIILAGGAGTRLAPATLAISKQLLPVFDKPMIYYPLTTLMLAGIKDIIIISTPRDLPQYQFLLGNGEGLGVSISYAEQTHPNGVAESLIIAKDFLSGASVSLILGDNIFYGHDFTSLLRSAGRNEDGATIFAYPVKDPERFGVVEFSTTGEVVTLEEKPENPKSRYAATGLYFFDNTASERAESITPSARGELEITDVNQSYLDDGLLNVEVMGRGEAWLDAGTHDSLLDASMFVKTLEQRQGLKIGCPEEVSWRSKWISTDQLLELSYTYKNTDYGNYLRQLPNDRVAGLGVL